MHLKGIIRFYLDFRYEYGDKHYFYTVDPVKKYWV